MDKIRKFQGIPDKKYRRIISHQIPIAFVGIEFQCKSAYITLCIGCSPLPCNRRKAGEQIGLFPYFRKNSRFGVTGNIVRDGESTESTTSFGMHDTFRYSFTVEMGQFFE